MSEETILKRVAHAVFLGRGERVESDLMDDRGSGSDPLPRYFPDWLEQTVEAAAPGDLVRVLILVGPEHEVERKFARLKEVVDNG